MLIVGYDNIGKDFLTKKYPDKVLNLEQIDNGTESDNVIEFIEIIKGSLTEYDVVFIDCIPNLLLCLDTLGIEFTFVFPTELDKTRITDIEKYNLFKTQALKHNTLVLDVGETIEQALKDDFNWINIALETTSTKTQQDENISIETTQSEELEKVDSENKSNTNETTNNETSLIPHVNKNKLTLKELLEQDIEISESDIRDLKATTNKLKVAMLLQAKSRLNTILKLCEISDKLYTELINRIDLNLATTDTASLMYTTEYISKALNDSNQFIMSLINNEKIQNFFIIDNSNKVININDNRIDITRREKIRKAAEIVMDNIDYFAEGKFENVVDPNKIDGDDVNATSQS